MIDTKVLSLCWNFETWNFKLDFDFDRTRQELLLWVFKECLVDLLSWILKFEVWWALSCWSLEVKQYFSVLWMQRPCTFVVQVQDATKPNYWEFLLPGPEGLGWLSLKTRLKIIIMTLFKIRQDPLYLH